MKLKEFKEKIVDPKITECLGLMFGSKNYEYSRGGDKLYNFKRAAEIGRTTPERALWGMTVKHWVSLIDQIEAFDNEDWIFDPVKMKDVLTDLHNYLFLLEGLFAERIANAKDSHNFVGGYDSDFITVGASKFEPN